MTVRRIRTVAAVDVPHGAWLRLQDGNWWPDATLSEPGGVAAGPHTALGYTPAGEPLEVQTDGGIMLATGAEQTLGRRIELHHGRIVS